MSTSVRVFFPLFVTAISVMWVLTFTNVPREFRRRRRS